MKDASFKGFVTTAMVVFASIACANVEYFYIHVDGLPYREARYPLIGTFYGYHLGAIIPLIGLISFQPFIFEALSDRVSSQALRRAFALGVGNLLLGLILEDAAWFMFRSFTPLPSDPLAHQGIRSSDYTAYILGHSSVFGLIVPLWYLILVPPIVAIFGALLMLPKD